MGRLLKALIFIGFIGFIALVGYAYLGDLDPEQKSVNQPVTLNVN